MRDGTWIMAMRRTTERTCRYWIAGICLALLLPACATRKSVGEGIDDAWITSKIKTKLAADNDVKAYEIDVDSEQGVVRLSGTVKTEAERQEAVIIARDTKGVVKVTNDIGLGDPSMAEHVDDKVIETKIKAKFVANPEINPFNIDVDSVRGGEVTLSGRVADEKTRQEAERIARSIEGVKQVNNRLELGAKAEAKAPVESDTAVEMRADANTGAGREPEAALSRDTEDMRGDGTYASPDSSRSADSDRPLVAQAQPTKPSDPSVTARKVTGTVVSVEGQTLVVDTENEGRKTYTMKSTGMERPAGLVAGAKVTVTVDNAMVTNVVVQPASTSRSEMGVNRSQTTPTTPSTTTTASITAPKTGQTFVGTIVTVEGDKLVLDTDKGRREMRIDASVDRPSGLVVGQRIGVMYDDRNGQLVATRLSTNPEQAEWMTFASPERSGARLPQTASQQQLLGFIGLLLMSAGAALRARRF